MSDWRPIKIEAYRLKAEGNYLHAIKALEKAITLAQNEPREVAKLYNGLADLYLIRNDTDSALQSAKRSLLLESEFALEQPNETIATYLLMLARIYEKKGKYSRALRHTKEALGMFVDKYGESYEYCNLLRNSISHLESNLWRG